MVLKNRRVVIEKIKDFIDLSGSLKTLKKPLSNQQLHDFFAQSVAEESEKDIVAKNMKSQYVKIVVFVPKMHADIVRKVMGDAVAGKMGNYSHCSFSTEGIGRFKPLVGAHPFVGEEGKLAEVEEERIECVCERSKAKDVISVVRKVHPYEEVAFDIFPLLSEEEV